MSYSLVTGFGRTGYGVFGLKQRYHRYLWVKASKFCLILWTNWLVNRCHHHSVITCFMGILWLLTIWISLTKIINLKVFIYVKILQQYYMIYCVFIQFSEFHKFHIKICYTLFNLNNFCYIFQSNGWVHIKLVVFHNILMRFYSKISLISWSSESYFASEIMNIIMQNSIPFLLFAAKLMEHLEGNILVILLSTSNKLISQDKNWVSSAAAVAFRWSSKLRTSELFFSHSITFCYYISLLIGHL